MASRFGPLRASLDSLRHFFRRKKSGGPLLILIYFRPLRAASRLDFQNYESNHPARRAGSCCAKRNILMAARLISLEAPHEPWKMFIDSCLRDSSKLTRAMPTQSIFIFSRSEKIPPEGVIIFICFFETNLDSCLRDLNSFRQRRKGINPVALRATELSRSERNILPGPGGPFGGYYFDLSGRKASLKVNKLTNIKHGGHGTRGFRPRNKGHTHPPPLIPTTANIFFNKTPGPSPPRV